jgi:putative iron-regulated protein
MPLQRPPASLCLAAALASTLIWAQPWVEAQAAPDPKSVLTHYADLAEAQYGDALTAALALKRSVATLIASPGEASLAGARAAWKAARVPYQQTEAYRFGNPIVDDWEGKVNAWPLDEGLIDYVDSGLYGEGNEENPLATANVIANPSLKLGSQTVDASTIDRPLLAERLHEAEGVDTNVATGYHAIEFLLWGQDLHGTGPGAGQRPASDFDPARCTGGHCERRAAYLQAATGLLADELAWMQAQWGKDGAARRAVVESDPKQGLATILAGMGSLSYGELAGERMKLGLLLHDPEEEHDCFSDNTHASHYYDALGIRNVYLGRYRRLDGTELAGPSFSELVGAADPAADLALRERLDATLKRMQALVDSAEHDGVAYDQLIGPGNASGNAMVQAAVDALVAQTRSIEGAIAALGLGNVAIEGSDSLDDPTKVGR